MKRTSAKSSKSFIDTTLKNPADLLNNESLLVSEKWGNLTREQKMDGLNVLTSKTAIVLEHADTKAYNTRDVRVIKNRLSDAAYPLLKLALDDDSIRVRCAALSWATKLVVFLPPDEARVIATKVGQNIPSEHKAKKKEFFAVDALEAILSTPSLPKKPKKETKYSAAAKTL